MQDSKPLFSSISTENTNTARHGAAIFPSFQTIRPALSRPATIRSEELPISMRRSSRSLTNGRETIFHLLKRGIRIPTFFRQSARLVFVTLNSPIPIRRIRHSRTRRSSWPKNYQPYGTTEPPMRAFAGLSKACFLRSPQFCSKQLQGSDRSRFPFCHFRFQPRQLAFWQPEEQFIPVQVLDDEGRFPPIVARNLDPFCADVLA